jgi:chromosome segregation ATPase
MLKQQAIIDDNKRVITEMVLEKDARKARLDDLQGMKEDMNNDIRKRRDELQRLEHERHRAAAELTSTRNQVRALREDMAKLAEMERTYRDELDHQRAELHKLKVEQTKQVDSLRLLSRDLDLARHEYGDLDHEVRRLDDIDKRARKELEMRRMRIDELAELENRFSKEVERLASARAEYGYTVDRLAATEERQRYELSTLERRASLSHPAAYPPMTGPLPFSAYAPPYPTGAPVASYYGPPQAGPVGTRPVLTAAAVAPTPYRSGAVANVVQH